MDDAEACISQFDEEGDGTLTREEFDNLVEQISAQQNSQNQKLSALDLAAVCNLTEDEAADIIAEYDPEGDGMLELDEFEDLKQQILSQQQSEIDNDAVPPSTMDDRISSKEFAAACDITEEDAIDVIRQYDEDGDGTLDPEDFEELKAQVMAQKAAMDNENAEVTESAAPDVAVNGNQEQEQNPNLNVHRNPAPTPVNSPNTEIPESNPIETVPTAPSNSTNISKPSNPLSSFPAANPIKMPSKREEEEQMERMRKIQEDRVQRQQEQQQQYDQFAVGKPLSSQQRNKLNSNKQEADDDNDDVNDKGDDQGMKFKHKWNIGMNFDPKTQSVVIFVSDAITDKKWGITLTASDFSGPIRQEYRKLGGTLQGGNIKYEYPADGGDLGVVISGSNGENYSYRLPQQI